MDNSVSLANRLLTDRQAFAQFISIIYILKSTESQKGEPCEMDSPLLKNDITIILRPQKPVIYSRNLQSGPVTGLE